jgi:DNA-binding response OmpR family regulator
MSLILVVDDDDDIREYLVLRLQRLGHDVVSAADGQAGLDLARLHRPDLVVTDWSMPRLTGIDLCVAIRDEPELSKLPILVITARSSETAAEEARAAGASDLMVKPFVPLELVRRVGTLLGARAGA